MGLIADEKCRCMLSRSRNGNYYKCDKHRNVLDTALRKVMPAGMFDGTLLTITMTMGFEDWGSYEDWGQGYIVEGFGIKASDKYLDVAVGNWIRKYKEEKNPQQNNVPIL